MAKVMMELQGTDEGKTIMANLVLRTASDFLRLLRSIEQQQTKKRASILWAVTIYTVGNRATIILESQPTAGQTDEIKTTLVDEMQERIKAVLA